MRRESIGLGARWCVAALAGLTAAAANAACYQVYRGQTLIYSSQQAPVDLSLPFSETVPARFGVDTAMIVVPGSLNCPSDAAPTGDSAGEPMGPEGITTPASDQLRRSLALSALAERYEDAPVSVSGTSGGGVYVGAGASAGGHRGARGPLMTGPRGGRYYMNSNGGKTYPGRGRR